MSTTHAATAQTVEALRAKFEAHAKGLGYSVDPDTRQGRAGGYWSSHTQIMWDSWCAALAAAEAQPESLPAEPVAGELHADAARSAARTALGYSQAFDGKNINWQSDEPWPHRLELAQALDWITELSAMVLNLADRADATPTLPVAAVPAPSDVAALPVALAAAPSAPAVPVIHNASSVAPVSHNVAAVPQPLTEWAPIELDKVRDAGSGFWLATKGGQVFFGTYEWKQGRNPDGFETVGAGRISAEDVTHTMLFEAPRHPAHGIGAAPTTNGTAPQGEQA